jgi:chemotaxis protein MotB
VTVTAEAVDAGARLDLLFERLAELSREIERLQGDAADRDTALGALRDEWRTVDGRTLRHEAGLDTVHELRSLVERLGERLEEEAALRRDAIAALTQARARDSEAAEVVERHTLDVLARVRAVEEQARQGEAERQRLAQQVGVLDDGMVRASARLDDVALQAVAVRDAERASARDLAAMESRLQALAGTVSDLVTRQQEAQSERRALGDAVSALRTTRDRELDLLDLLEQQRATRQRLEERLMSVEEGLAEAGRALLDAAEQRAQLRMQLAALDRQVTRLTTTLEAQRALAQRQLRAVLDAESAAGTRTVAEIERRARERSELLRRLHEESEQLTQGGAQ